MLERIKEVYAAIKGARIGVGSLLFIKLVILTSFIPVILYITVWAWMALGKGEPPLLKMLEEMRLFVGTVFSTQVVAAVLAYGVALVDKNDNGESDDLEGKVKKHDTN